MEEGAIRARHGAFITWKYRVGEMATIAAVTMRVQAEACAEMRRAGVARRLKRVSF
jgi:hypothetical protein